MSAADLLIHLRAAGFDLAATDSRLMVTPASKLTDGLRAELRACKPELIALLAGTVAGTRHDIAGSAQDRPYRLTREQADAAHADVWNEAAIARFETRNARLRQSGISEHDADDLAERLHLRDVHADDRRLCLECRHYRPGRCGNPKRAGLSSPEIGRDLATLPQRCPGFTEPTT